MEKTNSNQATVGGPGTGRRHAGTRSLPEPGKPELGKPELGEPKPARPKHARPKQATHTAAARAGTPIPEQASRATGGSGVARALAGARRSGLAASGSGAALGAAAGRTLQWRHWRQGIAVGIRKGWNRARTLLLEAAAVGRSRLQRRASGQRPMTVVDQIAAGPRLRAVLLQVDGKRILLAANGDHAPALLDLGATPAASRRLATSKSSFKHSSAKKSSPEHSIPKHSSPKHSSSGKSTARRYASGWNAGATMPVDALGEHRLLDRATGGEIQ